MFSVLISTITFMIITSELPESFQSEFVNAVFLVSNGNKIKILLHLKITVES